VRREEGDELTGFLVYQAGAQTLRLATGKVDCTRSGAMNLLTQRWAIIHTEDNVSLTVDSDDISCY
jgi:hypothetical protein